MNLFETQSTLDTCGYGLSPSISAQAVKSLPPEPQVSKVDFVINAPEFERECARISWRILIQVAAMQMDDYRLAQSVEDKDLWKSKILDTLTRINKTAQKFSPQSLPSDIPAPTEAYRARSAAGNWCLSLTGELTCLFTNA